MFDTSKSVSYHIRLLVSASVKSGGKSSIATVGFKKGNGGRLKEYNVKAESPTIAGAPPSHTCCHDDLDNLYVDTFSRDCTSTVAFEISILKR